MRGANSWFLFLPACVEWRMSIMRYTHLILGGGMVAGYAAKEMAERGLKAGRLGIISADSALPYERPPLSKGFLAGKDTPTSVLINPESFYSEHGIGVHLRTRIRSVDVADKRLTAENGDQFTFDHLVIATGARVRTLDIPGASMNNVLYLRSLDDSERIRDAIRASNRALVIGSGFIGMEVASQCAGQGLETTMVFPDDRVWKRLFTPEMSRFFQSYYEKRGVRIIAGAKVTAFTGRERAESATLSNGDTIPIDFAVAGIGVAPVIDVLEGTPIQIDDGVVVNEYLETSAPGVYAAGDMARYRDVIFDKHRRIEHWDNAVKHGQYLARRLMGETEPFHNVPYFFSDIFDLSYEYWGDQEGATEVVYRGSLAEPKFSAWWLKRDRLIAAFVMARPDQERELAQKWIQEKTPVSREAIRAIQE
jgi:NADPH-dependent 2,4-dienoyl-CoA reductase/sulfur reductase-like enzyme